MGMLSESVCDGNSEKCYLAGGESCNGSEIDAQYDRTLGICLKQAYGEESGDRLKLVDFNKDSSVRIIDNLKSLSPEKRNSIVGKALKFYDGRMGAEKGVLKALCKITDPAAIEKIKGNGGILMEYDKQGKKKGFFDATFGIAESQDGIPFVYVKECPVSGALKASG
jgi:hypothetical protein